MTQYNHSKSNAVDDTNTTTANTVDDTNTTTENTVYYINTTKTNTVDDRPITQENLNLINYLNCYILLSFPIQSVIKHN